MCGERNERSTSSRISHSRTSTDSTRSSAPINSALPGLFIVLMLSRAYMMVLQHSGRDAYRSVFALLSMTFICSALAAAVILLNLHTPNINVYAHPGGFMPGLFVPSLIGMGMAAETRSGDTWYAAVAGCWVDHPATANPSPRLVIIEPFLPGRRGCRSGYPLATMVAVPHLHDPVGYASPATPGVLMRTTGTGGITRRLPPCVPGHIHHACSNPLPHLPGLRVRAVILTRKREES